MASLPVPAKTYFDDFSFDLLEYVVKRNSLIIGTFEGLTNNDELGNHIAFLISADIQNGDILASGNKTYIVRSIDIDTYNREPQLIKAYF